MCLWFPVGDKGDQSLTAPLTATLKGLFTLNDSVTVTWMAAPFIFLTGTMTYCIPTSILPVSVTFVMVTLTVSFGVYGP